jgi:hypothetical protein
MHGTWLLVSEESLASTGEVNRRHVMQRRNV